MWGKVWEKPPPVNKDFLGVKSEGETGNQATEER